MAPDFLFTCRDGIRRPDPHSATASKVHDVAYEKVTAAQRRQAKSLNFGIFYTPPARCWHSSSKIRAMFAAAGNTIQPVDVAALELRLLAFNPIKA